MNDELEELLLVGGRKSEVGGHNALFLFFSRSSSSRAQNHVNSSPDPNPPRPVRPQTGVGMRIIEELRKENSVLATCQKRKGSSPSKFASASAAAAA